MIDLSTYRCCGRPRTYPARQHDPLKCNWCKRRERFEWQLRNERRQCPTCCRWFIPPTGPGRSAVHCSRECTLFWCINRDALGRASPKGLPTTHRWKRCEWCGDRYQGLCLARFCSTGCQVLAAGTQRSTDRMCRLDFRGCACGETFIVTYGQQTMCGDCRRDEKQRRNRSARHRDYVLARDRWTCHICAGRIPKRVKYPHALSASIDHLIPKSEEGSNDDPVNLAAAHLGCNIRRRTGGIAQLRLVG